MPNLQIGPIKDRGEGILVAVPPADWATGIWCTIRDNKSGVVSRRYFSFIGEYDPETDEVYDSLGNRLEFYYNDPEDKVVCLLVGGTGDFLVLSVDERATLNGR